MKKTILYTAIILLLTIITISGTYAYLTASVNSGNNIVTEGHNFEVIYTGGTNIEGSLNLVSRKEDGLNTTVNIRVSEDSVLGKANIYIQVEEISEKIATEALKWEVYKTFDGVQSLVDTGTFLDCEGETATKKCESGDRLYIVKDYKLSATNTAFTVYIWLDGNLIGNEAIGASFNGYIGAESENITGDLE